MPGHDMTRFYPLLPVLAILATLYPDAFRAVVDAAGMLVVIRQLH
ncbi:hypothetical protein [Streptomyces longwoodensis]|nr:hypothetical protein [Streptomyces longwoodensis]MCX5001020.1 hypothetical protein [Streptomyces longwoodensis]